MPARTSNRPVDTFWVHRGGVRQRDVRFHRLTPVAGGSDSDEARPRSQSPPTAAASTCGGRSRRGRSPGADAQQQPQYALDGSGTSGSNFFADFSPASIVQEVVGARPGGSSLSKPPSRSSRSRPVTASRRRGDSGDAPPAFQQLAINPKAPESNPRFAARNRDFHGRNPFATSPTAGRRSIAVSPVAVPAIRAVGQPAAVRNRSSPTFAVTSPTVDYNSGDADADGDDADGDNAELDPLVQQITQRILAQRARAHHDDPGLALSMGRRAGEAKQHRHRRPEHQRPRRRDQEAGCDGPLGSPLSTADRAGALQTQQDRATWGTRFCACNTYPCEHIAPLPANAASRLVLMQRPSTGAVNSHSRGGGGGGGDGMSMSAETKQRGMSVDELRAFQKVMDRRQRMLFRHHAVRHNSVTFHRGRVNGS